MFGKTFFRWPFGHKQISSWGNGADADLEQDELEISLPPKTHPQVGSRRINLAGQAMGRAINNEED